MCPEESLYLLVVEIGLSSCQEILLENVKLGEKIARNQALKENVFMMVVCVELRIPLFLVGKPGSSKSLAKAIVADAMQGAQAKGDLFKTLKEVRFKKCGELKCLLFHEI